MQPVLTGVERVWKLPPLILHPFSDASGPGKLVESSRANLMMQGLLPSGELSAADLDRRLLDGRFCELRMLCYVGRDLVRWIEQCAELAERDADLRSMGLDFRSFATFLVEDPPLPVRDKLRRWGVADYRHIFSRALGLNAVFANPPSRDDLAPEFIRHYYRFADEMYRCLLGLHKYPAIKPGQFNFDLYASGEYARMLERQWEGGTED
ncbi:MAG: hypothetical protein HY822_19975 [Acidobacteria bacterium]|nr:hypothetical protein [Acidobacteriota bacterium]